MEASSSHWAGQEVFYVLCNQKFPLLNHNIPPLASVPTKNLNQNSHLRPHTAFVLCLLRCNMSHATSSSICLLPSCKNAPFLVICQTYREVPSISGGCCGEYEWTAIFTKRNAGLWSAGWGYRASDPDICTVCCMFSIAVLLSRATFNDIKLPCRPYVKREKLTAMACCYSFSIFCARTGGRRNCTRRLTGNSRRQRLRILSPTDVYWNTVFTINVNSSYLFYI